jgi:hypothetical protein
LEKLTVGWRLDLVEYTIVARIDEDSDDPAWNHMDRIREILAACVTDIHVYKPFDDCLGDPPFEIWVGEEVFP